MECLLSISKIVGYGQVLLQEVDFKISSPELLPGFVLLVKLRSFAWLYSSSPNYSLN